jgi:hypothetical protein
VEFVEADMRDFDLGRRFSLIFLARNSLLHLSEPDDFVALFAAVRRHLGRAPPCRPDEREGRPDRAAVRFPGDRRWHVVS